MRKVMTLVCSLFLLGTLAWAQGDDATMKKSKEKKAPAAKPQSDAEIQKCVQDKLASAPKLKTDKINVAVSGGEATLTGNVKAGKGAVTRIAQSCGAKKVVNNIVQEQKTGAKKEDEKKG